MKTRILAAFAATGLVLAAVVTIGTSAVASGQHPTAKPVPKPKVGQCYTTTYAQIFAFSSSHKPVSCAKSHTARTFAVMNLPKGQTYKKINEHKLGPTVAKACVPKFWKALGSNNATRDQTSYTWYWFAPTRTQRKQGARWFRCDLALLVSEPGATSSQLDPLPHIPFPVIGSRPITDATRVCLADATHSYETTCSHAHAARSDRTFTIASVTYPSAAAITAAASTKCPGERAMTEETALWKLGDHTVVCFTPTTS